MNVYDLKKEIKEIEELARLNAETSDLDVLDQILDRINEELGDE